jgi:hypothetical protein
VRARPIPPYVATDRPARLLQALRERSQASLSFPIVRRVWQEHADAPHPPGLLRACRERPRRRAAEQRDEVAAVHSMTSSAIASSLSGTARPSALAVLRLITNSNFVGC